MKHAMIDLETLGTSPDSVLLSIGAVQFDPYNFNEDNSLNTFYKKVSIDSQLKVGRTIDASTLEWWLIQKPEVLKEALTDANPIEPTLYALSKWVKENEIEFVWGNSARFDMGILVNAFTRMRLPIPWDFRKERCYRTIIAEFPIKKIPENIGNDHNALDDALYQVKRLSMVYEWHVPDSATRFKQRGAGDDYPVIPQQ